MAEFTKIKEIVVTLDDQLNVVGDVIVGSARQTDNESIYLCIRVPNIDPAEDYAYLALELPAKVKNARMKLPRSLSASFEKYLFDAEKNVIIYQVKIKLDDKALKYTGDLKMNLVIKHATGELVTIDDEDYEKYETRNSGTFTLNITRSSNYSENFYPGDEEDYEEAVVHMNEILDSIANYKKSFQNSLESLTQNLQNKVNQSDLEENYFTKDKVVQNLGVINSLSSLDSIKEVGSYAFTMAQNTDGGAMLFVYKPYGASLAQMILVPITDEWSSDVKSNLAIKFRYLNTSGSESLWAPWTTRLIITDNDLTAQINSLKNEIQQQLNQKIDLTKIGQSDGVAELDSNGKVPTTQLPDSILGQLTYGGTIAGIYLSNDEVTNATVNLTLVAKNILKATSNQITIEEFTSKIHNIDESMPIYFIVATTYNGNTLKNISFRNIVNQADINVVREDKFSTGDWAIFYMSMSQPDIISMDKVDNTDAVSSVNGKTGVVDITKKDVGLGNVDNLSKKELFSSPNFEGTPTAPTPDPNNSSTRLATTQYVQNALVKISENHGINLVPSSSSEWSEWIIPTPNLNNFSLNIISVDLPDEKKEGDSYTTSAEFEFSEVTAGTGGNFLIFFQNISDGTYDHGGFDEFINLRTPPQDGVQKFIKNWTIDTDHVSTKQMIGHLRCNYWGSGKFRYRYWKVEKGTIKEPSWTPNPNDIITKTDKISFDNLSDDVTKQLVTDEEKTAWNSKADLIDGKVPSTQLPSYVDDVIEFEKEVSGSSWIQNTISTDIGSMVWNAAIITYAGAFYRKFIVNTDGTEDGLKAINPEEGKIYVNLNNGNTYRWSGSNLIEISKSLSLGETSTTAYAGNKGKANADAISIINADLQECASFAETELFQEEVQE